MWRAPSYDCQQCGACCINRDYFGGTTAYVFLLKEESKRMKRLGLKVVQVSGHAHLGTRANAGAGGHTICTAFKGGVGDQCGCGIYEDRPRACREFAVGSPECEMARHEAGMSANG